MTEIEIARLERDRRDNPGCHSLNHTMFNLARGYREEALTG
jgi:hypothetical protein